MKNEVKTCKLINMLLLFSTFYSIKKERRKMLLFVSVHKMNENLSFISLFVCLWYMNKIITNRKIIQEEKRNDRLTMFHWIDKKIKKEIDKEKKRTNKQIWMKIQFDW